MYYIANALYNQDSLNHYGVLGMKWGVRKNPSLAYAKASKKLRKMDKKIQKTRAKAEKAKAKYYDKEAEAQSAFLFRGIKNWNAGRMGRKTARLTAKANRAEYKGYKWTKSMNKEFSKAASDFTKSKEDVELGRKYVDKDINTLARNSADVTAFLNNSRNSFRARENYQILSDELRYDSDRYKNTRTGILN